MSGLDYLTHLRRDSDAVLAVVAGAALTEPVTACPGWSLRDLVVHLGGVQRWATTIVRTGTAHSQAEHVVDDVAGWFAAGADHLLEALSAAPPPAPCWSFTTDRTAGFWRRRQALEAAVHRWDAQRAVGPADPIDAELAADGVAEVVELLTPRQLRLGRLAPSPGTVQLRAVDTGGTWALGEGPAAGSVQAPAETLLLLLWNRVTAADRPVQVDGEAGRLLGLPYAP